MREKYGDLKQFKKIYNSKVKKFLSTNSESRIIFLNAEFGWGKTTFVKETELLGINDNCIYSPWLNESSNYLEEIYFHVKKKDKSKDNSLIIFLTLFVGVFSTFITNTISVFTNLCNCSDSICRLTFFNKPICYLHSDSMLFIIFKILLILLVVVSIVLYIFIFRRPVPLISFFKSDNGKYYEDKIIKEIVESFSEVFVIEDIDRVNNIEDVLVVANKISKYIVDNKLDKYILITGDFNRTNWRIGNPMLFDSNPNYGSNEKGPYVLEKTIGMLISFPSIDARVYNLMCEYGLDVSLTKIESDEILNFIKVKHLSIRFFVRFLTIHEKELKGGQSLFHLFIKFYQEEKRIGSNSVALENSLFNIERFPNCMNDYEMLLSKKRIRIGTKLYTINNIKNQKNGNNKFELINYQFNKLLFCEDINVREVFRHFFIYNIYPRLDKDMPNNGSNKFNIGSSLKPNGIIINLENFLIGSNNNEGVIESFYTNKRCYFDSVVTTNNYDNYKYRNISYNETEVVDEEYFYIAYFACFMRDNFNEMSENYPFIFEKISAFLQE